MTMLADATIRLFSRTQFEEALEKRAAGALTRWFCRPLLHHDEAMSLCASVLRGASVAAYLVFGIQRWSGLPLLPLLPALVAPLLAAAALTNILARLRTEELLVALARPLWFLSLPLLPFARALVRAERRLGQVFNGEEDGNAAEDREEIIAAVTDGRHEGVVEETEREMIVNIFDLKKFDISDIMTPRTDVCAIPIATELADAVAIAREKGYSRFPVYEETRDNIRGIFNVKDILDHWNRPAGQMPRLAEILRPAFFVPETKNVGELMRELQRKKIHMAVVLDEYGGTAGLVTIEDVLEEIVGEIQDEYDSEKAVRLDEVAPGLYEVDARVRVHDMNERLREDALPETEDYETVGGFVLDRLGHLPEAGESFCWEGLRFTILAADERRVDRIRVERFLEDEAPAEAEAS